MQYVKGDSIGNPLTTPVTSLNRSRYSYVCNMYWLFFSCCKTAVLFLPKDPTLHVNVYYIHIGIIISIYTPELICIVHV